MTTTATTLAPPPNAVSHLDDPSMLILVMADLTGAPDAVVGLHVLTVRRDQFRVMHRALQWDGSEPPPEQRTRVLSDFIYSNLCLTELTAFTVMSIATAVGALIDDFDCWPQVDAAAGVRVRVLPDPDATDEDEAQLSIDMMDAAMTRHYVELVRHKAERNVAQELHDAAFADMPSPSAVRH